MSRASRIPEAITYIREHWKKGESLKEVAARFGLDPGNLDRAFKKAEGVSHKAFLDRKRRQELTRLLRRDGLPGYEIARMLGFASDVSFYRWVKRAFGTSLSVVRRDGAPPE